MEDICQVVKCGYCNYFLGSFLNNVLEHSCFQGFDAKIHEFYISDNGMITMRDQKADQNESVDAVCPSVYPSDSQNETHDESWSEQHSDDAPCDVQYSSTSEDNQSNDFTSGVHDELLISLVQNNPPLYDHRLPAVQRTKLKKKDIWTAISNHFEGDLFTPTNAEKRWNYLRENYLKARKKFLEAQYVAKKSGSAATTVPQPNYRYYQLMDFLNEPISYKTTISSLKSKAGNGTHKSSNCGSKAIHNKQSRNTDDNYNFHDVLNESDECENQSHVENETFAKQPQPSLQNRQVLSLLSNSVSPPAAHTSRVIPSAPAVSHAPGITISPVRAVTASLATSPVFPVKTPPSSNSQSNSKKRKMTSDIENQLVQMLQKESKETDEVDGFLLRLGAGLRRLNYQARARLEIKFLTCLNEEEELQNNLSN